MQPINFSRNTTRLPHPQPASPDTSRRAPAIDRAIVLTPLMGGADGISEMTRQWVHVLESHVGHDIKALEVWSLDDDHRPAMSAPATGFRTARGGRLRFSSFAVSHAGGDVTGTLIVAMHLQLLPVALPLVLRGARLVVILMGIEAWKPLRPLERAALQRAWKVVAISTHTIQRFRRANPWYARGANRGVCSRRTPHGLSR